MKQVLETLTEWQDNIACDMKADWISETARAEAIGQNAKLAMAIGLLQSIGQNLNIPA